MFVKNVGEASFPLDGIVAKETGKLELGLHSELDNSLLELPKEVILMRTKKNLKRLQNIKKLENLRKVVYFALIWV